MKIDYLMLTLCIGVFITNANNSFISPFFPDFSIKDHDVGQDYVGIIFSFQPVGVFSCSLAIGKIMNRQGFKIKSMFFGLLIQSIGIGTLIFLQFISKEYNWLFIIVGIIGRFIQGIGHAMFVTPAYSVIPLFYLKSFEQKMGWLESVCGLGLMCGPMLGGIVFQYLGYTFTFVFFIIVSILIMPLISFLISDSLNKISKNKQNFNQIDKINEKNVVYRDSSLLMMRPKSNNQLEKNLLNNEQKEKNTEYNQQQQQVIEEYEDKEESKDQQDQQDQQQEQELVEINVNYKEILSHIQLLLTTCIIIIPTCGILFFEPTISPYLADSPFNLEPQIIGLILMTGTFSYIVLCPVSGWLTEKIKNNKLLLFLGTFISGIGFLFAGPDHLFTFCPQKLYIVIIGYITIAFGVSMVFIPDIPELVNLLNELYPDQPEEIIGDIASTLENSAYALGCFLGPITGGYMSDYLGFPRAAAIYGLSIIGFSIIYLFFGGLICNKKNQMGQKIFSKLKNIDNIRTKPLSFNQSWASSNIALAQLSINSQTKSQHNNNQNSLIQEHFFLYKNKYILNSKQKLLFSKSTQQDEKQSQNYFSQHDLKIKNENNNNNNQ